MKPNQPKQRQIKTECDEAERLRIAWAREADPMRAHAARKKLAAHLADCHQCNAVVVSVEQARLWESDSGVGY